jgi:hypothetical protein
MWDSDSEEEWARTLCRSTRRRSPTPPERVLAELRETMPKRSRTNVQTYPTGSGLSEVSASRTFQTYPTGSGLLEGEEFNIRDRKDTICIGGQNFVRGRDFRGQVRLLPTSGSAIPTPARDQAAKPPPRLPTTPVVVRVRSCGGATTFQQGGSSSGSSSPPALCSSRSSSPPPPPPAADMPAGPLELPRKEHRRDSDSEEDSSEEECDYKLDVQVQPHHLDIPHIIHWRLVRAAYTEIGVDWCKSVSYKEWPESVKALCIYRIEMERLRLGGTRFKIGITHCPRWRFIDAPYAYTREDPPWGKMEVLWVSDVVDFASDLEKDLIFHYKNAKTTGRCNIKNGGDSAPKIGPCFVYCVFGFGPFGGSRRVRELYHQRQAKKALKNPPGSGRRD